MSIAIHTGHSLFIPFGFIRLPWKLCHAFIPLQSKLHAPHLPAPRRHSPVGVIFFQFGQLLVEVTVAVIDVMGDLNQHLLNRNTLAHILNVGADGIQGLLDI